MEFRDRRYKRLNRISISPVPLALFLLSGYMPPSVSRTNDTKLAFPVCVHPGKICNFASSANSMLVQQ